MKIKRLAQYILPHIQKDISWIENKKNIRGTETFF